MKRKIYLLVSLLLILSLILASVGCSSNKTSGDNINSVQKPLVLNLEGGDWGYPTPYGHYSRGPGVYKMTLIFDSLLERGEEGMIPWLAEKWDISPDGKIYTFVLRKNVKWHDGQKMTAEDVKFSFEYFAKYPPVWDQLSIDGKSFVEKIDVLNDNTVKITVDKPNATLLGRIGNVKIIPKHIWEKVEDPKKFNTPEAVIGCGPYKLTDYNKEQGAYRYEAFHDYWGPKPKADVIQFIPVSDGVLAFDKGDIDLTSITPDIIAKYENKKEFKIKKNPAFWGYRLIFNMEKRPELKDKELRQAIAYAIDQNELVEKVARGAAVPASAGYLPVDHVWYNQNVKKYDYNIDKAKELLKGKKYSFTLLISNSNAEIRIAELLQISLAKAGIDLNVKSVDMKTRDAAVKNGDYEMVLNGHGGWGNDADMLRTLYANEKTSDQRPSSDGIRGYRNEQINDMCQKQLVEMDEAERKKIVFELQELIAEEVSQIPLYNTTGYIVYRPDKYDGWKYMFDHHEVTHNKLSYLEEK